MCLVKTLSTIVNKTWIGVGCVGGAFCAAAPTAAQVPLQKPDSDPVGAVIGMPRLSQPINFDGVPDDVAWQSIEPLQLVQYEPRTGAPITEPTDVRVAIDDEYVYVGVRCLDSRRITETTFRRDDWSASDDQVALMLDSFNDYENGKAFVLYATGARIDAELFNDGRNTSDVNTDWNSLWDGKVTRDDAGWYAEMRIPASTLRFETDADGSATMGMIFYRHIARTQELQIYPAIPPDWGFWSFLKPSRSQRIRFDGLKPSNPLYVSPYLIGGIGQNFDLNAAETEYIRSDDPTYDVGFDLKYSLSSNMTLDLTVNTDFAQVEADNQQVNLTRFSLFFPEKRQFFLERTSNFDFGFGNNDRVFYSRRVGLNDGAEVAILGGGRVVGRVAGWDVGVLSIQSARQDGLPSQNASVARLKKRVFNNNSYAGGIVTARVDEAGDYNAVYGVDGVFNLHADDYVGLAWAQSIETDGNSAPFDFAGSRFRAFAQRPREVGLGYEAGFSRAGEDYNPGLGFQARSNFSHLFTSLSFGIRPGDASSVLRHFLTGSNDIYYRNEDGSIETRESGLVYELDFKNGFESSVEGTYAYENLADGFELSDDAEIMAGTYRFAMGSASIETPSGNRLKLELKAGGGGFYDGTVGTVLATPRLSVSANLQLSGSYEYNRIRFADRGQNFHAHLVSGRLDVMLSTKLAIAAFVQYSSEGDVLLSNVRFRFNPREGNDFYLVYNEGFNVDRLSAMPSLPVSSSRVVVAKYTHTFRFE